MYNYNLNYFFRPLLHSGIQEALPKLKVQQLTPIEKSAIVIIIIIIGTPYIVNFYVVKKKSSRNFTFRDWRSPWGRCTGVL